MNDDILIVTRTEHHAVKTCPCDLCIAERARRQNVVDAERKAHPTHRHLTPEQAHLLGYIAKRTRSGSIARDILTRSQSSKPT